MKLVFCSYFTRFFFPLDKSYHPMNGVEQFSHYYPSYVIVFLSRIIRLLGTNQFCEHSHLILGPPKYIIVTSNNYLPPSLFPYRSTVITYFFLHIVPLRTYVLLALYYIFSPSFSWLLVITITNNPFLLLISPVLDYIHSSSINVNPTPSSPQGQRKRWGNHQLRYLL